MVSGNDLATKGLFGNSCFHVSFKDISSPQFYYLVNNPSQFVLKSLRQKFCIDMNY